MKILFFDYWTKGIHNFTPIAKILSELKHDHLLLHLGSWRDPNIPWVHQLNGIVCKDIRSYGNSLRRALKEERPDLVLMLNTTMMMDRTMNRICRNLGIKTAYMMHGIRAMGSDQDQYISHQNRHWGPLRRLGKVPKYVALSFAYLDAIAHDNPYELLYPATYGHFLQLIVSPGAVYERPWPHKDIHCDIALVYAKVYAESLIRDASYPVDRVKVVGNPNLDSAFAFLSDISLQQNASAQLEQIGVPAGRQAAVYMEDGFVEAGIGGWTEATRTSELRQVAKATNDAGLDLVIKMHPASNPVAVQELFRGNPSVHVVLSTELTPLVWACVAVIGHISTTLMLPIVLDRPIVVPTWSPGLEEFSYYVGVGVAIPAATPNELTGILQVPDEAKDSRAWKLSEFIDNYVTHTDGQSLNRIVESLVALGRKV